MSSVTDTQGLVQHASVLIVDDDAWVHRLLENRLKSAHYQVHTACSSAEALAAVCREEYDVILLDIGLPDQSGLDTMRRLRSDSVSSGIIIISGDNDAQTVVEAMRLGALDYLVKPLDSDKVLATVGLAARAGRLERENRRLASRLRELNAGTELVGASPAMRRLAGVLRRVAESDATVLIEGKPGSGKSSAAGVIRGSGRRAAREMLTIAADAATPESLEKDLAAADEGTLVIEDIDLMPAAAQSRLVRFLKESGAASDSHDTRIIATTSARLPELVAKGKFREDLYYRLNVFPIVVPSLHERSADIALLATHFLRLSAEKTKMPQCGFTASAMILLESHPWPGNVAQLENAVTRAHALAGDQPIDASHLLGPSTGLSADSIDLQRREPVAPADETEVREEDILPLDAEEKRLLARALRATKGNVRRAAQLLRIGRATLYRKIQVYDLRLH